MSIANPINSLITGAVTAGAILIIRSIQPGGSFHYFSISILVICSLVAFFFFVVRDEDYQFKLWYGFDEITIPRIVRGFSFLIGAAVVMLISESI